jgi:hypothetical protein
LCNRIQRRPWKEDVDDIELLNQERKVGGRGYDNGICRYNKGKKTNQPQPKEEGLYEFTNATT